MPVFSIISVFGLERSLVPPPWPVGCQSPALAGLPPGFNAHRPLLVLPSSATSNAQYGGGMKKLPYCDTIDQPAVGWRVVEPKRLYGRSLAQTGSSFEYSALNVMEPLSLWAPMVML